MTDPDLVTKTFGDDADHVVLMKEFKKWWNPDTGESGNKLTLLQKVPQRRTNVDLSLASTSLVVRRSPCTSTAFSLLAVCNRAIRQTRRIPLINSTMPHIPRTDFGAHNLLPDDSEFDSRWVGASIRKDYWHFYRQLFRRYGLILAPGEFSKIVADIKSGRARLIRQVKNDAAIYRIRINRTGDRVYILVVDGMPRTAWPVAAGKRLAKKVTASSAA